MTVNPYRKLANRAVAGFMAAATALLSSPTAVRAETNLPQIGAARATTENACLIAHQAVARDCTHPAPVQHVVRRAPPPRPVAPPVAEVPTQPAQPPIVYDISEPIGLPGATVLGAGLSEKDKAFVDSSDCNYQGFWNAVAHPINAQCVRNSVSQTSTMAGQLMPAEAGKVGFAPQGLVIVSATRASEGVAGQGYLPIVLQGIGTFASIGIGIEGLNIAASSLKATQSLNGSVTNGINSGKFTSLFGSLGGCGVITNVGSSTGSNKANCNIGNVAVNSTLGIDSATRTNGGVARITAAYGTATPR